MEACNKAHLCLKSTTELLILYPPPGYTGHGRWSWCIKKLFRSDKFRTSLWHSPNEHSKEMSCSKRPIIHINKTNLEGEESVLCCRWHWERNRFAQGHAGSLWQSQELNTTLLKPRLKIVLDYCTWTPENTHHTDYNLLTSVLELLGSISLSFSIALITEWSVSKFKPHYLKVLYPEIHTVKQKALTDSIWANTDAFWVCLLLLPCSSKGTRACPNLSPGRGRWSRCFPEALKNLYNCYLTFTW